MGGYGAAAEGYDSGMAKRDAGDYRARARASALLPEERSAGVDDAGLQAAVILEESDVRQMGRDAAPDAVLEKRRSAETV